MSVRSVRSVLAAFLALAAGALSVATVPPAVAAPPAVVGAHVPGVVLVGFEPGASAGLRQDARRAVGALATRPVSPLAQDVEVLTLPGGADLARAIVALAARPGVRYAEPDYLYTVDATSNDPYYTGDLLWGMYGDLTSPDNRFGSQAGEAWAAGLTGSSTVYVGILDTGIDATHPDLQANVGIADGLSGKDFVNNDNDPADDNGHGTHVAGTIGAVGGNGLGVAGVNWSVSLLTAKVGTSNGTVSTSAAAAALDYFTALRKKKGVNIVATNSSWGSTSSSNTLLSAINRGGDAGILFIASAGNSAKNNDVTPYYPASYRCTTDTRLWDCLIAVAAVSEGGGLASFSNFGAVSVDLAAPGTGIWSTYARSIEPGGYARASGTSEAAPHVTGAVALCAASASTPLSAQDLRRLVLASTVQTTSLNGRTVTEGRLDAGSLAKRCAGNDLTVSKGGGGTGSITSSPAGITCGAGCVSRFEGGSTVTLTATPASGSGFTGWSGAGCSGRATTCTVTMDAAKSVTATFQQLVVLSVQKAATANGAGTVTSDPVGISCGTTCARSFPSGDAVTLTAAPASGSVFVGWSTNCIVSGPLTCVVTIGATKTYVSARFATTRTLTVAKTNPSYGTVASAPAGIDCGATCSYPFAYGTSVVLTATPILGRTFVSWSNCPSPSGATCTVSMTSTRTITANFA